MHKEARRGCATDKQAHALMHTHTRPSAEASVWRQMAYTMPGGRAFSFAAWAVPAQQNDERNKANTDNGTLAHLQPSQSLATQCLQKGLLTLTHESRGSHRAECKRDLQATYGLRYLSRLQQLLLKELGYPLLRQRASAAAS